jgi:hypothetical protein
MAEMNVISNFGVPGVCGTRVMPPRSGREDAARLYTVWIGGGGEAEDYGQIHTPHSQADEKGQADQGCGRRGWRDAAARPAAVGGAPQDRHPARLGQCRTAEGIRTVRRGSPGIAGTRRRGPEGMLQTTRKIIQGRTGKLTAHGPSCAYGCGGASRLHKSPWTGIGPGACRTEQSAWRAPSVRRHRFRPPMYTISRPSMYC